MIRDTSHQDVRIEKSSKSAWLKSRMGTVVTLVVILLVSGFYLVPTFSKWSSTSFSIDASRLRVSEVSRGEFVRDLSVQGKIIAANRPMLFAPESGNATLSVRAGDRVSTGDLIAEIESPELLSQLEQEQATLQKIETELSRQEIDVKMAHLANDESLALANIDLSAAKRDLERASIGLKTDIVSKQDYEKAVDENSRALAKLGHEKKAHSLKGQRLNLELDILKLNLERQKLLVEDLSRKVEALKIYSPVTGIVGNLEIEQKSVVNRDQPIMSVVDMSAFEIDSSVPEIYANDLALGMQVEIEYSGNEYVGELTAISPEIKDGQVSARVRFSEGTPENLRQNQRVTTTIIFDSQKDVLMVDRGPFVQNGAAGFAYVIEDGVAVKKPVQFGVSSVSRIKVVSGLNVGDQVIISSSDVFEGHERVLLNNLSEITI